MSATHQPGCSSLRVAPLRAVARMGSASWAGWLGGVKDLALTDEQLAQRDLTRTDPEVVRRFGKGTAYNLKARAGALAVPRCAAARAERASHAPPRCLLRL